MKLNPKKCAIGMREGTFLGYKVNADGLRVCPYKVEAVLNLPSPKCLKDVQKLNGKLTSLNKFLSKSAEKSLPFIKTLKKPRTSVTGQIIADFIVECPEDDPPDTPMKDKEELPDPWVLFRLNATNNEAKYKALIAGLRIAEQMGVKNLQANVDSRLVANQVNEIYVAKEPGVIKYFKKVKNLASAFKEFSIKQVPRGENKKADTLSKMTSTSFTHLSKQVLVEELKEKSIDEKEVLAVVEEEGRTWMTPIYEYLTEEILPEEKKKLRCVGPLHANYVLREIHEGSCSMHAGPRSMVAKALRLGYYWPTMHTDARNLIRECSSCQHPQSNNLVERENRSLGEGIKAPLDERRKNWLEEISHVLWAHRTMIKSSNGETPFSLTYETEAVIPVEIGMPTLRTAKVNMIKNDEALEINLDLLEERREQVAIQEAKKQSQDGKIL
ncbi:reverse transcriptase domain-containing protein [Tanacetum coccineum]